ncbi:Uncharacterized membrane protein YjdF [Amycolatopsis arida]|uniref:Uncharacterized membrane protein YjdF n=1 Tax=Amycolatopsis arida TaxID=587909 RepID=A0A1I5MH76_9PSEU|nr:putative membrane protein YjdF [Amycolatopsis arida]SFP08944.1 Uncharacterized membrane protein YjdF [Amycolatopsis arida]
MVTSSTTSATSREPAALLGVVLAATVWSGIDARDLGTWLLEMAPVAVAVPVLVAVHRRFPLTLLSYRLLTAGALFIALGAHYTYAEVPLGFWLQDWFGFERNHYDRVGHFVQGLVAAVVLRELLRRRAGMRPGRWLVLAVTLGSLGLSAAFELVEMLVAAVSGQGGDYLATRGDPLDSQWDMAMALSGAVLSQLVFSRAHDRQLARHALAGEVPGSALGAATGVGGGQAEHFEQFDALPHVPAVPGDGARGPAGLRVATGPRLGPHPRHPAGVLSGVERCLVPCPGHGYLLPAGADAARYAVSWGPPGATSRPRPVDRRRKGGRAPPTGSSSHRRRPAGTPTSSQAGPPDARHAPGAARGGTPSTGAGSAHRERRRTGAGGGAAAAAAITTASAATSTSSGRPRFTRNSGSTADTHSGTLPCLRRGPCTRLSRSIASPPATAARVCAGSITSSTSPRSAA